ncbi:unnamed protein product, partial [Discosporangium mesarthrocarpum]
MGTNPPCIQVAAGFYHSLCLAGPAATSHCEEKTLSTDMWRLVNSPSWSDVTFLVEGKTIHGHRCIITSRCEPLARMLEGPMREGETSAVIPVPNHSFDVFLALIEFLYTDKARADVE